MRKIICLLLVMTIIVGCAAFKSVHYGEEYSPATTMEKVEVLSYEPGQKYIKLGEVTVFGVTDSNRFYLLNQLREMAAEMGGDAIVLQEREFPKYTPKPIVGIVIKWQDK